VVLADVIGSYNYAAQQKTWGASTDIPMVK
jgi:hypothetical protein